METHICIPGAGSGAGLRQVDPWSSLAGQPTLIDELPWNVDRKETQWRATGEDTRHQHLASRHTHVHVNMHAHAHIHLYEHARGAHT